MTPNPRKNDRQLSHSRHIASRHTLHVLLSPIMQKEGALVKSRFQERKKSTSLLTGKRSAGRKTKMDQKADTDSDRQTKPQKERLRVFFCSLFWAYCSTGWKGTHTLSSQTLTKKLREKGGNAGLTQLLSLSSFFRLCLCFEHNEAVSRRVLCFVLDFWKQGEKYEKKIGVLNCRRSQKQINKHFLLHPRPLVIVCN